MIDVLDHQGQWNMNILGSILPNDVCLRILSLHPPSVDNKQDCIVWMASKDGWLTVKSSHKILSPGPHHDNFRLFNAIWNWCGMQQVRTFLWKLSSNALVTNAEPSEGT
ncbi:hypothetical protein RIF29_10712 [Crotalaria pallida]|uniref:Reverse transcriptase zinc-binding domain-containing protein n=1 Tax=Crotalaria pallida TaxID=3830 RepID=A0AAN9FW95_CROPI